MSDIYTYLIEQINVAEAAFCRFVTANDVSLKSHQSGFLVSKAAATILFDSEVIKKRENSHNSIRIRWQNCFETASKAHYYGAKKNELRITCFGRNFPFLKEKYVGSLLVMCKISHNYYTAVFLTDDDDIDDFYSQYNIASVERSYVIKGQGDTPNEKLQNRIQGFVAETSGFPSTKEMSEMARTLFNEEFGVKESSILKDPDKYLLRWINTEYLLFHSIEEERYRTVYIKPFPNCQALIDFSKVIQNRRKSRAGKSLEHHLAYIFTLHHIRFCEQEVTEDNKKPDFLFPGIIEYKDPEFPKQGLTFLGAKTTCKDRWRQVLNEASLIDHKYLFTLQKGISINQICEMEHSNLTLVIPSSNKKFFAKEVQDKLISLRQFIDIVKEKQKKYLKDSRI